LFRVGSAWVGDRGKRLGFVTVRHDEDDDLVMVRTLADEQ